MHMRPDRPQLNSETIITKPFKQCLKIVGLSDGNGTEYIKEGLSQLDRLEAFNF